jgi:NDP-sugar pyrophosphorylase family protein
VPKALVPVCGKPLLARALDSLDREPFSQTLVNVHYLANSVLAFRQAEARTFSVSHEKDEIRGTGGALDHARVFLESDETFCVMNVDILSSCDPVRLARQFLQSGSSCTLVAAPAAGRGTVLRNTKNGTYAGLPNSPIEKSGAVEGADFIGLAFYRKEFLSLVRTDDFSVVPVWRRAVERNLDVRVTVLEGCRWYDVGSPSALAQIHFDVVSGQYTVPIPEGYTLDLPGKRCYPSTMKPAAVNALGDRVWCDSESVGPRASLRRSVIFQDAVVRESESLSDVLVTPWGKINL